MKLLLKKSNHSKLYNVCVVINYHSLPKSQEINEELHLIGFVRLYKPEFKQSRYQFKYTYLTIIDRSTGGWSLLFFL
jgi:hypothetical protein